MTNNFDYIITKIQKAKLIKQPFNHYIIKNIFSDEHYAALQESGEINLKPSRDIHELVKNLLNNNYEIETFPGCVTDVNEYVNAIKSNNFVIAREKFRNGGISSFGMCFKLKSKNKFIKKIQDFFCSKPLLDCIKKKLKVSIPTTYNFGIQKYLSGYELSPHPDIRTKKATLMLNINHRELNNDTSVHTCLLRPKENAKKIIEFWKKNKEVERNLLRWDDCEMVETHNDTNSLLMFSPSDDSLHGVKLKYNDLKYQRTNLYANLWVDTDINTIKSFVNNN
jgi:hypothetical protein